MILIADSGSTKTDWCLLQAGTIVAQAQTTGINPYFQDDAYISDMLRKELSKEILASPIEQIYFYGAGCSVTSKQAIVQRGLQPLFQQAKMVIEHDLLAAARALCGKEKGMAAILGTGSNSCYYDGNDITEHVSSLGFILGDEGSGAYMGKALMQLYLYKELDPFLVTALEEKYELNPELVLDKVYKQQNPNRFLASFFEFIYANREHTQLKALIEQSLTAFLKQHICKYTLHQQVPLNCVGSIGFLVQDELKAAAQSLGIKIGKTIKSPMEGLIDYHK